MIDKPSGLTSTAVLRQIKKVLKIEKIGHAGTLDPLATGLLGVALGEATKVISYVTNDEKQYEFALKWGWETDTDDCLGTPTLKNETVPTLENLKSALQVFTGKIEQVPPRFSALKVQGQRAYALARAGVEFTLNKRWVDVKDLQLIASPAANLQYFSVTCSKGTYVRSLARDIARHLGGAGHVVALRRLRIGSFSVQDAILLDNFLENVHTQSIHQVMQTYVRPLHAVLDDIPAVVVSEFQEKKLRQGQCIEYEITKGSVEKTAYCVNQNNQAIGLVQLHKKDAKAFLCPERIFNI